MCAFSDPVMRSHPSSAPDDNFQIWDDDETILFMKDFTEVHVALADYKMQLMKEHSEMGRPFTRHMMLHFPDNTAIRGVIDEFMLGENILMAPVFGEDVQTRDVVLPGPAQWTHWKSGEVYNVEGDSMSITVAAPLGQPAVFYRDTASYQISKVLSQFNEVQSVLQ